MLWQQLVSALGLALVLEGLAPFLSPGGWRRAMLAVAALDDRALRLMGLAAMGAGLLLLHLAR